MGELKIELTLKYKDERTLNEISQKLMKRSQHLRSENKQPPKQITSNNNNINEQKGTTLFKSLVVFFNKIVQLCKELPSDDDRKQLIKDMNQFPWDITQFTFDVSSLCFSFLCLSVCLCFFVNFIEFVGFFDTISSICFFCMLSPMKKKD
jgi:V8-like Glu-specific endopeptidase